MNFEIVGPLHDVQAIAIGKNIRELARLRREYGKGRWRKMKASATIRYIDGEFGRRSFIGMKPMALVAWTGK
jgi:hypothetical protein